jgi:NTP pyrophosphatase (non-canonical NTP hydrolase)
MTKKNMQIKINDYVEWTGNTCASLESKKDDNAHMLFGMLTEVGELTDVFKKNLAYDKSIDWINVREEIGDLIFYIASFCRINGLDLETIVNVNVAKLEARYPEKFSNWRANNRDLDKERNILEKN